jgi:hypothetical protein
LEKLSFVCEGCSRKNNPCFCLSCRRYLIFKQNEIQEKLKNAKDYYIAVEDNKKEWF